MSLIGQQLGGLINKSIGTGVGKPSGNPKFHSLLKQMAQMHDKKSADYASNANYYSNFEQAAVSAGTTVDTVFRVLIGIKLARLAELQANNKTPKNESIMDSLIDLAVYSTLYASYYDQSNQQSQAIQSLEDMYAKVGVSKVVDTWQLQTSAPYIESEGADSHSG